MFIFVFDIRFTVSTKKSIQIAKHENMYKQKEQVIKFQRQLYLYKL
jgi:hypothetical protein